MSEYKLVPVEPTEKMCLAGDRHIAPLSCSHVYKAMLAAAPSPGWVKTSERLPTRDDSDESGLVWVLGRNGVVTDHWSNSPFYRYWMPGPRVQPPAPPEGEHE